MTLTQRIDDDYKSAFKARRKEEVSCLRLIRAALKNKEKEARQELTDDEVVRVLKTLAKQRQDSAEQFRAAGRDDLATTEEAELKILAAYLPAEIDEATAREAVGRVIEETGASSMKDMGRVMKAALDALGAGADGKMVNQIVREILQAK